MAKSKQKTTIRLPADNDRVPVLKPATYCSPACGGHCTKASFDQAVRGAKQLVKALDGSGWQAAVWENLDWHFKAQSGTLVVYGDYHGAKKSARFACTMLGRNPDNFMSGDPNEAVRHTVTHCIAVASQGLDALFVACEAAHMKPEFFRVFSQLPAVEFLRFPGGRSIEGAARFALAKDPNYEKVGRAKTGRTKPK